MQSSYIHRIHVHTCYIFAGSQCIPNEMDSGDEIVGNCMTFISRHSGLYSILPYRAVVYRTLMPERYIHLLYSFIRIEFILFTLLIHHHRHRHRHYTYILRETIDNILPYQQFSISSLYFSFCHHWNCRRCSSFSSSLHPIIISCEIFVLSSTEAELELLFIFMMFQMNEWMNWMSIRKMGKYIFNK